MNISVFLSNILKWLVNDMKRIKRITAFVSAALIGAASVSAYVTNTPASAEEISNVEALNRGISAINTGSGMLISWRFLANDADNAVFKLYRDNNLIYTSNADMATCFLDKEGNASSSYRVDTVSGGKVVSSENCSIISDKNYFDIPMDVPPAGSDYTYSPNDCSAGDVDGDGTYEIFVKWDPSNSQDNSKSGYTGNVYIDCYRLSGEKLWRIDLGKNIRAGAHYTQFIVADFDLDGKAEMTCKTADGTVDGTGKVIGDASKDYRNSSGYILSGPEYYTLFDGATGAALDTVDYEYPRGEVSKSTWGDNYGNRVDRFLGSAVYLDGVKPSAVSIRGYYTRMTAVAYDVVNKKLVKRWGYDTGYNSSAPGYGDGNHNCMPADVDGDGKQELVLGATCIDDNGQVLWCNELGHGDAMHLSDMLPDRPGLELWVCHEHAPYGVSLLDAATGKKIFHYDHSKDTGRCGAGNIYAGNPGAEFWGAASGDVYDGNGQATGVSRPAQNFLIHWDGDLERELLDNIYITKINANKKIDTIFTASGCASNNSTKATPNLTADLFGDWREELVLRTEDNKSLRVFCTPYETNYRITTLMHDVHYRMQVSAEQTSYNQPPHTGFYLGSDQPLPERPRVAVNGEITEPGFVDYTNTDSSLVYAPETASGTGAAMKIGDTGLLSGISYTITNKNSGKLLDISGGKTDDGTNIQQWSANGRSNQQWRIIALEGGWCRIVSLSDEGKCLALETASGENGVNVELQTYTGADNQIWKIVESGNYYGIVSKCSEGKGALDVYDWSTENGGNVNQWEYWEGDCQLWTISPVYPMVPSGEYTIRNLNSGLFIAGKDGNAVQSAQEKWTFTRSDDGTYTIQNEEGNALTVENGSAEDGANIGLAPLSGDVSQKFTLMCNRDGSYALLSVVSEGASCADVFEISKNDGANICQWNYWGGDGQKFILEPAETEKKIIGDVNADGVFSILDAVMLQKYLHGLENLTDMEAGELTGDGKISIFDLCVMKQMLVQI